MDEKLNPENWAYHRTTEEGARSSLFYLIFGTDYEEPSHGANEPRRGEDLPRAMITTALDDLLQYEKICTGDDIFYFNDDSIYVANHCWRENLRWPPSFRSRRHLAYPKDFLKNVIISLCTFDNFNKYPTMRVYAKV